MHACARQRAGRAAEGHDAWLAGPGPGAASGRDQQAPSAARSTRHSCPRVFDEQVVMVRISSPAGLWPVLQLKRVGRLVLTDFKPVGLFRAVLGLARPPQSLLVLISVAWQALGLLLTPSPGEAAVAASPALTGPAVTWLLFFLESWVTHPSSRVGLMCKECCIAVAAGRKHRSAGGSPSAPPPERWPGQQEAGHQGAAAARS